ncbi:hypothetical protein EVAR_40653_1 [Eumeta japonica]|uniref:Uncharacterized protein n=1 Tax=Eumeta variegata TaxID=151549 RepID=A0A4C1X6W6_EUMVA|nr:hypothetical protein EVAR_40653_1 [Eumeta japonica]
MQMEAGDRIRFSRKLCNQNVNPELHVSEDCLIDHQAGMVKKDENRIYVVDIQRLALLELPLKDKCKLSSIWRGDIGALAGSRATPKAPQRQLCDPHVGYRGRRPRLPRRGHIWCGQLPN